ncbi:MAG: hypothetical protein RLZZ69_1680 [Cyanobacteriota bacterium]
MYASWDIRRLMRERDTIMDLIKRIENRIAARQGLPTDRGALDDAFNRLREADQELARRRLNGTFA